MPKILVQCKRLSDFILKKTVKGGRETAREDVSNCQRKFFQISDFGGIEIGGWLGGGHFHGKHDNIDAAVF